jgi:hypothetical protein
LVFRFDAMQPLSFYPAARQAPPRPPSPLASLTRMLSGGVEAPPSSSPPPVDISSPRCAMLRAIGAGLLRALASVHAAGVAHGSLGAGGVLLSTYDDARAGTVRVCLDNFGFATLRRPAGAGVVGEEGSGRGDESEDDESDRPTPPPLLSFGPGSPGYVPPPASAAAADDLVSAAQAADAAAAGRVLLETVLAALLPSPGPSAAGDTSSDDDEGLMSGGGTPPPAVRAAGAALVGGGLARDAGAVAALVRSNPDFAAADALLSAGDEAGYSLLARLADGDARFGDMLRESWFLNGGRKV